MTTIPGASQFLNSSTLSNEQGFAGTAPATILGGGGGAGNPTSLLEAGRSLAVGGFGASSSARALNSQFLSQSQSLGNQILSLGVGTSATVEGAQQEILALRGGLSDRQLAPSLRGQEIDQEA